jgi:truncated hemoglobin YjbI
MTNPQQWNLTEDVGGCGRLREMMRDFYRRVFDDTMIGFFFDDADFDQIVDSQIEYVRARLGNEEVEYHGKPIRRAHQQHPILVGHFDRRHQILKDVLREYEVPEHVFTAWIGLELKLRELVVRTGGQARDEILGDL